MSATLYLKSESVILNLITKKYVIAGVISSIISSLLIVLISLNIHFIIPGFVLGLSIYLVCKSLLEDSKSKIKIFLLSIIGSSLAWFLAYLFACYSYAALGRSLKIPGELLILISGGGAGIIGAIFLSLVLYKLHNIKLTSSIFIKPTMAGFMVACLIFPFVFMNFYLYILLFLPWQTLVLWSVSTEIYKKI